MYVQYLRTSTSGLRRDSLVVCSSNPLVDDVNHALARDGSVHDKGGKANHGKTSVDDFGFLGQAGLHCWKVSISFLASNLLVVGVVGVNKEGVTEWKRAESGHEGNSEGVSVGNENDGTFVGDGGLSRDGGESSPLLEVKSHVGIRDQSVALAVGSGADEEPSEHGVASIPLLGLNGWSPSPLSEGWELLLPFGSSIFIDSWAKNVQGAGQKHGCQPTSKNDTNRHSNEPEKSYLD